MSRTRLLFVIESLSGGGAEKVLATLITHLDRDRFDITLCPIVDIGRYADALRTRCHYHPIMSRPTGALSRLWYRIKYRLVYRLLPLSLVYRLWVPKGNDVEVAFCEGFATRLLAHSSNHRARRLAWVHTDLHNFHYTREAYPGDAAEAAAYNSYDHIVAVSRTAQEAFAAEFPSVTVPVTTAYNPIDAQAIRNAALEPTELPPLREGATRIVTVGRLTPIKGFDRLIRVTRRLVDDGHDIDLWILGSGSEQRALEQLITDLDLTGHVTLWGFKSNPYPYLAAAHLFVCPSRAEGFSLVIAEALTLGIPVISTDCAGPGELLENGRLGAIVPNDDDATAISSLHTAITHHLTTAATRDTEKTEDTEAIVTGKPASREALLPPHFALATTLRHITSLLTTQQP